MLRKIQLLLASICCFLCSVSLSGQVTIWSVDFNNGCASDCIASTYGGWTIQDNVGGVTGGAPNNWFVSCAEEGIVPPGCGSTCIGDASLHIGANPGAGGDMGASFNETGAANATFRLAVSPTISTVGYVTNTLAFDFIAFGSSACSDDRAQLRLSTDNGATWPVGFQYCLTSVCCGACNGYSQGQWTTYTLALPAAFDNNPNVRIGFHWRNNGNGSGTDPSVAIDDPRITTVVAPVDLVQFKASTGSSDLIHLDWVSAQERNLDKYEIERSLQPSGFVKAGTMDSKGTTKSTYANYGWTDPQKAAQTTYYRLKMLDVGGTFAYSPIVRVVPGSTSALDLNAINIDTRAGSLTAQLWSVDKMQVFMDIVDMQGKNIFAMDNVPLHAGENNKTFDISGLPAGVYFLRFKSSDVPDGFDPANVAKKFVIMGGN
jgi:hypothetical protein